MQVLSSTEAGVGDEVQRLRAELIEERVASVRALARATRLSQLITALGQVVDLTEVFDRAVCEVTELFGADIAVLFTPTADGFRPAASWGLGTALSGDLPLLDCTRRPTRESPVVAGPVADFDVPEWLRAYGPVHITWGLFSVRDEPPGYLVLVRRADTPFENADVHELAAVASRIALAVDNGRLYRRTQEQLQRSRQLHEVTADLARSVDVGAAAQRLAEALVEHVPVASAGVHLGGGVAGSAGEAGGDELTLSLGGDGSSIGTVVVTGAPAQGSLAHDFLEHVAEVGGLALERAQLFEHIRRQAETDALTGLPNRALFMGRLAAAMERCRAEESDLAVLFMDLDGFKAVNDTHGHEAGDLLLIEVARRLTGAVGEAGTCARLGGDEFVVLLERGDAVAVADGIRRVMDEPFVVGGLRLRAGGSVGIGTAATSGYDAEALLRDADTAMYAAKQARRQEV
ncbi:GGDEF domain-containing protein [Actinoplanes sp. NPDC051851]|uniref:GGDEF domain-containing protein n=1 Tax=Actinoplanes sp. NPDC051851 TaxID=3154753 RepID=UPI0034394FC2